MLESLRYRPRYLSPLINKTAPKSALFPGRKSLENVGIEQREGTPASILHTVDFGEKSFSRSFEPNLDNDGDEVSERMDELYQSIVGF